MDPGYSLMDTNEHLNNWIDVTVAREIMRGQKLREMKPQYCLQKEKFNRYPMIIIPSKPSYNLKRRKREPPRKNFGCGCRPLYPNYSQKSRKIYENEIRIPNKCSLRIAELAVPSKRHCMDTWRNKSYLLPEYMVERLKQHVMDQRPIVKLSDAVRCFQMRKPRIKKKFTDNTLFLNTSKFQKPLRYLDTNALCLIFAHKIMLDLSTIMNLQLCERMEKIYRVVSDDITKLTKNGMKNINLEKYGTVHAEVCNKITIWINEILEDSYYKLLEDNLRELEEEEGPVLDYLDDVVDKVLEVCVPETVSDTADNVMNITDNIKPEQDTQITINNDILPIMEHFRNEIHNIINNIFKHSDNELESEKDTSDNITDIEYFINEIDKIISTICEDSTDQYEDTQDVLDNVQEDIQLNMMQTISSDNNIQKSSVGFNNLSKDADDESVNVIFSITDMANDNEHLVSQAEDEDQLQTNTDLHYTKRNIYFAEPNQNLLSTADELWPKGFSQDALRPSTSVTKSVQSLGKVYESDEKPLNQIKTEEGITKHTEYDIKPWDKEIIESYTGLGELPQSDNELLLTKAYSEKLEMSNLPKTKSKDIDLTKSFDKYDRLLPPQDDLRPARGSLLTKEMNKTNELLNKTIPSDESVISDPIIDKIAKHKLQEELQDDNKRTTSSTNIFDSNNNEKFSSKTNITGTTEELGTVVESKNIKNSTQSTNILELVSDEKVSLITSVTDTVEPPNTTVEVKKIKTIASIIKIVENDNENLTSTVMQNSQTGKLLPAFEVLQVNKNDTGNNTDQISTLEEITQKDIESISTTIVNKQLVDKAQKMFHDSKVQMENAPAWFTRKNTNGESSRNSTRMQDTFRQENYYPLKGKTKKILGNNYGKSRTLPQCVLEKWCQDLDNGFKTLDIWQFWLINTCKEIECLRRKRVVNTYYDGKYWKNLVILINKINKDAKLWREVRRHSYETFGGFHNYYSDFQVNDFIKL